MEIAQQNSSFRTCYYENNKNKKQESKHIIHLIRPKINHKKFHDKYTYK